MYLKPITVKDLLEERGRILTSKTKLLFAEADRYLRNMPKLTTKDIERRLIEKRMFEKTNEQKNMYKNFPLMEQLERERIALEVKAELLSTEKRISRKMRDDLEWENKLRESVLREKKGE